MLLCTSYRKYLVSDHLNILMIYSNQQYMTLSFDCKSLKILEHDNALLPPYFKTFSPFFKNSDVARQTNINSAPGTCIKPSRCLATTGSLIVEFNSNSQTDCTFTLLCYEDLPLIVLFQATLTASCTSHLVTEMRREQCNSCPRCFNCGMLMTSSNIQSLCSFAINYLINIFFSKHY